MAFQLTVEQVSFPPENYGNVCSSVDSLNSVVDANTDFIGNRKTEMDSQGKDIGIEMMQAAVSSSPVTENDSPVKSGAGGTESLSTKDETATNTGLETPQVLFNEANTAFSYESFATSYPEIPLPVAQVINKNNPEWCSGEKFMSISTNSSQSCSDTAGHSSYLTKASLSSPFESMAASSEALALQHSVIGSREVKPVSPDVVAEVVAKTRLKLSQMKSTSFSNGCDNIGFDETRMMTTGSEVLKSLASSRSSRIEGSRRSSCSSVSSVSSKRGLRDQDIPSVHTSRWRTAKNANGAKLPQVRNKHPTVQKQVDAVADSETESCFSERFELESLCSEGFETGSNLSDVSGLDDEVFRVRRFLTEDTDISNGSHGVNIEANGTSLILPESKMSVSMLNLPNFEEKVAKKDQSTETDLSESFELLRAKANLEGRLESITRNEMDLAKECTNLKAVAMSLKADVEALTKQCESAVAEKQKALKELDSERKQQEKWDSVLKEYQNIIESKDSELRALKEDLSEVERASTQSRMKFEELKVDMELKEGSAAGLKKKIAELHVEVQVLLQGKVQLENEVKSVRHEMETLQKSKAWYQEQLRSTQESRNKLHQDLIALQSEHVSLTNGFEKAKTEIGHLKQQLSDTQHRAVAEKEILMKHLETIEADMMEREALFEEIQKDKGSVENAFLDRAKKMEEERSKLTNLMFSVSDLDYQLNVAKNELADKNKAISELEKEKVDLTRQLTFLQKSVTDKGLNVQRLEQALNDANSKIKHIEASLCCAENLIGKLKEEKTASDVALASANEEKRIVNESLRVVKDNLNQVENNFKKMRTDLVAKTAKVEQLMKEKDLLEEALSKSEEKILHQQKRFEQQMFSESQNREKAVGHLKRQKNDIENVLDVYSKDLLSYQQTIQHLEKEKADLKAELSKVKHSEICMKDKLNLLSKENESLQGRFVSLSESLDAAARTAAVKVYSTGEILSPVFEQTVIGGKKMESDKIKKYRSNIKLLIRKLKEKMKECESLKHELKQVNETKEVLDLNVDRPDIVESSKHGESTLDADKCLQMQEELKQVKEQLELERSRVEQNQMLVIELEKEKGKISAVSDSSEILKQRISELEAALSEKGSLASQLACKLKVVEEQLMESIQSSQSRLSSLEESLNKEKAVVKSLRKQVFEEKRTNSHLSRQLNMLKSGLEQSNQIADSRKAEIAALQLEIEQKVQAELKHRGEAEQLRTEICLYKSQIENLKKELVEVQARDPALAEQIKSLSWHLKEKSNEIAALKEKEKFIEERHSLEVKDMEKSIKGLKDEIESYKKELDAIRKEKFHYQSQFAQLRKVLGSKLRNSKPQQPYTVAISENAADSNIKLLDVSEETDSTFDESYVNSLLQRSFRPSESRPLSHLQACLNSLKREMAVLQEHLCDNKGTA